ncbi:membrane protein [Pseudohongiella nitratireducens]|uniref:Membrane protein n=1 Tax=Pseudohongiella nitratireducens TaxID=1768907 RepID=A0A917GSA6_9GAMM|nr:MAPEG family protein [Pseudohongiella nitratireducens]GGG55128.1 membrane protein [Pseudohongiella nitratireducens]|tara:strand:- start:22248 stop:22634 length:387 start_codon:yes stop_codon:yes gene_type:complete
MHWVNLIAILALLQFIYFGILVGKARGKYKIDAPAVSGHPEFERYYRVQMNTLEMLVFFLPTLYLFAEYVSPLIAAGAGVIYLIGRFLYQRSYVKDPKTRSLGFALTILPSLAMALVTLIYIVMGLIV